MVESTSDSFGNGVTKTFPIFFEERRLEAIKTYSLMGFKIKETLFNLLNIRNHVNRAKKIIEVQIVRNGGEGKHRNRGVGKQLLKIITNESNNSCVIFNHFTHRIF